MLAERYSSTDDLSGKALKLPAHHDGVQTAADAQHGHLLARQDMASFKADCSRDRQRRSSRVAEKVDRCEVNLGIQAKAVVKEFSMGLADLMGKGLVDCRISPAERLQCRIPVLRSEIYSGMQQSF